MLSPIFFLSLDLLTKCFVGSSCWRQNCPEGCKLSKTSLAGEEGSYPSGRRGITGLGSAWEHGALVRAGDVPGCCSVGVSAYFPPVWNCRVLRNLSKSRKICSGRNLLHIPFIHISLLTGVIKTSQKLLYSRVAAEKELISRRVTFALRCAYLFIVYQSRE